MYTININNIQYSNNSRQVTISGTYLNNNQPIENANICISDRLNRNFYITDQNGYFSGIANGYFDDGNITLENINVIALDSGVIVIIPLQPIKPIVDILNTPVFSNDKRQVIITGHIRSGTGNKQYIHIVDGSNIKKVTYISPDNQGNFIYIADAINRISNLILWPVDIWGENVLNRKIIAFDDLTDWSYGLLFT